MQKSNLSYCYSSARRNRKTCASSGNGSGGTQSTGCSQNHRHYRSLRQHLRSSSQSTSSSISSNSDASTSSSSTTTAAASNKSTAASTSRRSFYEASMPVWGMLDDRTAHRRSSRNRRKRNQRENNKPTCSSTTRSLAKYAGTTEWQRRQQMENLSNSSSTCQVSRHQSSRLHHRKRQPDNSAKAQQQDDTSDLKLSSLKLFTRVDPNASVQPVPMYAQQYAVKQQQQQQQQQPQQQEPIENVMVPKQHSFSTNVNFNDSLKQDSQPYLQQPKKMSFNSAQNGLVGSQYARINQQNMLPGQQQQQQQQQWLSYGRQNCEAPPLQNRNNPQQYLRPQTMQNFQYQKFYQARQQQQQSNNSIYRQQLNQQQHNSLRFQQPLLQQQQQRQQQWQQWQQQQRQQQRFYQHQPIGSGTSPISSWDACVPADNEKWTRYQRQRQGQPPMPHVHHPLPSPAGPCPPSYPAPLVCSLDEDPCIRKSNILAPPPPDFSSSVACPVGLSNYFDAVSLDGGLGLGGEKWKWGYGGDSDPISVKDSPAYTPFCEASRNCSFDNGFDRF